MSIRKFELLLPMGGLYGVSIYKRGVETEDGYMDEPVDPCSFDWRWYVNIKTYECVRAAKLSSSVRVLASPIGEGPSAYDVPHNMLLVHDLGCIWAMGPMDFQTEYDSAELLIGAMPRGNVGTCVFVSKIDVTGCGDCPFHDEGSFGLPDSCGIDAGPPPRFRGRWDGVETMLYRVPLKCQLRDGTVWVGLAKTAKLAKPKALKPTRRPEKSSTKSK